MKIEENSTVSQKVGMTLKLYREKSGHSQGAVASNAGISTSMLSQIERGQASPSIDTLASVCRALSISISDLFARVEERKNVEITQMGHRLSLERDGAVYEQLASYNAATGSAELFLLSVEPGCSVGFHGGVSQSSQEGAEMGYILSGSALLLVDNEPYEIQAGDGITFSASLPHKLENRGTKLFKAVWTAIPSQRDYLGIE